MKKLYLFEAAEINSDNPTFEMTQTITDILQERLDWMAEREMEEKESYLELEIIIDICNDTLCESENDVIEEDDALCIEGLIEDYQLIYGGLKRLYTLVKE